MRILIFDTETTGFVTNAIAQLACKLIDTESSEEIVYSKYLNNGVPSEPGAFAIHRITDEIRIEKGVSNDEAYAEFKKLEALADKVCAHNLKFDARMFAMNFRQGYPEKPGICTMLATTNLCKLPSDRRRYKWPKLEELHRFLFNEDFEGAHDAMNDVNATHRCLIELITRGVINV